MDAGAADGAGGSAGGAVRDAVGEPDGWDNGLAFVVGRN